MDNLGCLRKSTLLGPSLPGFRFHPEIIGLMGGQVAYTDRGRAIAAIVASQQLKRQSGSVVTMLARSGFSSRHVGGSASISKDRRIRRASSIDAASSQSGQSELRVLLFGFCHVRVRRSITMSIRSHGRAMSSKSSISVDPLIHWDNVRYRRTLQPVNIPAVLQSIHTVGRVLCSPRSFPFLRISFILLQ